MDVDELPHPHSPVMAISPNVPLDNAMNISSMRPLLSIKTRQSQSSVSPSSMPPPRPPPSTRDLLVGIAQLSDEVMIAANEKVNLTRFACDLVSHFQVLCS